MLRTAGVVEQDLLPEVSLLCDQFSLQHGTVCSSLRVALRRQFVLGFEHELGRYVYARPVFDGLSRPGPYARQAPRRNARCAPCQNRSLLALRPRLRR